MEFKPGDVVIHPAYGVCKILGIEKINYQGAEPRPYYVVDIGNGKIWIPTETQGEIHIRPITSRKELSQFREVLRSQPSPLNADRYKRSSEYKQRLRYTSFQTLCEVVRDLNAHGWDNKLNDFDSTTLRKITERLVSEWALADSIPIEKATEEINALLTEGRETYHHAA